ncbi:MAG: hypothetical protein ACI9HK_003142 [Pirellulaceae bacterium]|jgi:hypothetical protein
MPDKLTQQPGFIAAGRRRFAAFNRAAELFEEQPASEKRRLLEFVVSNSSWAAGELTIEFRQPFDLIAVGVTESKQKNATGVDSDDLHQVKYTWLDTFRTTLAEGSPDLRGVLGQIEDASR